MRFHCLFSLRIPRDVAGLRHRGELNVFHWILACQASRNGITTLFEGGGGEGGGAGGGGRSCLNRIALHGTRTKSKCSTLFEIHEWQPVLRHSSLCTHPFPDSLIPAPRITCWPGLQLCFCVFCLANKFK